MIIIIVQHFLVFTVQTSPGFLDFTFCLGLKLRQWAQLSSSKRLYLHTWFIYFRKILQLWSFSLISGTFWNQFSKLCFFTASKASCWRGIKFKKWLKWNKNRASKGTKNVQILKLLFFYQQMVYACKKYGYCIINSTNIKQQQQPGPTE